MIEHPASTQLRARTSAIADPGNLQDFLTPDKSYAFLRGDDGVIGLGEIARFETDSLDAADLWWQDFCENLEDESEFPGSFGFGPVAFGSFCFDPDNTARKSTLIVPQVIIGRRNGQCWMTRLGYDSPDSDTPEKQTPPQPVAVVSRLDHSTTAQQWMDLVAEVVSRIKAGEAEKVVIARDQMIHTDQPIDHRWLVKKLVEAFPRCWTYSFDGFIGSSPEMLLKQTDQLAASRVLAGTYPTSGQNGEGDSCEELASALVHSEKNQYEHRFARDSVAEALKPYCSAVHVPEEPYVLRLPNVLHLASDITGLVKQGNTALAVAGAIHPTAAVCGSPMHVAAQMIAELEGFDRGRYAGPVGWVDSYGNGEWALGLRCGQILADDPKAMQIFAGCGLVADSDPAEELEETNLKFLPMLSAFGLAESTKS